jgi:ABC-type antimicrobial peptide transport system permease subunit
VSPDWQVLERPYTSWHGIFAKLKPGVSLERARAAMHAVFQQVTRERLAGQGELPPGVKEEILAERLNTEPAGRGFSAVRKQYVQPLRILFGVVALLLLIACANFANLLLARGLSRSKEVALREALGAGRARLVRQLMIESVLIALLGGLLALAPAITLARVLLAPLPDGASPIALPVGLDGRVVLFTLPSRGTGRPADRVHAGAAGRDGRAAAHAAEPPRRRADRGSVLSLLLKQSGVIVLTGVAAAGLGPALRAVRRDPASVLRVD